MNVDNLTPEELINYLMTYPVYITTPRRYAYPEKDENNVITYVDPEEIDSSLNSQLRQETRVSKTPVELAEMFDAFKFDTSFYYTWAKITDMVDVYKAIHKHCKGVIEARSTSLRFSGTDDEVDGELRVLDSFAAHLYPKASYQLSEEYQRGSSGRLIKETKQIRRPVRKVIDVDTDMLVAVRKPEDAKRIEQEAVHGYVSPLENKTSNDSGDFANRIKRWS